MEQHLIAAVIVGALWTAPALRARQAGRLKHEHDLRSSGADASKTPVGNVAILPARKGCLPRWKVPARTLTAMGAAEMDEKAIAEAVNHLADEYRIRCLWFLRPDYYPATREERLRVLHYIEIRGDRKALQRAATLKRWLSQDSSATSAGS